MRAVVMTRTHTKGQGQIYSVQNLEWKQTDKGDGITSRDNAISN